MKNKRIIREKDGIKKPTRFYSSKQEESVAKSLNGKKHLNSGATSFQKSDVSTEKFLIECKTKMTESSSISIKKDWLDKVENEALFMGKPYTALAFNFGPNCKNYYIISEELFQILIGKTDER